MRGQHKAASKTAEIVNNTVFGFQFLTEEW